MPKKLLIDTNVGLGWQGGPPYGVMGIGDASVDLASRWLPFGEGKVDFHSTLAYLKLRQVQRHTIHLPRLTPTLNTYPCNRPGMVTGTRIWHQTYSTTSFLDYLQPRPSLAFIMIERDVVPGMIILQYNGASYRSFSTTSEVGKLHLHCFGLVQDQELPALTVNVLVYLVEDPLEEIFIK